MPDIEKLIAGFKAILKLIFGEQYPEWLLPLFGWLVLVALLLAAIVALLTAFSKIMDLWSEKIWPRFYNVDERRRATRRRRFADHIESELRRLNNLEEWRDYRFTELEAEVE